jgi:energy-coupling factor transporter ATP-binding protein EcfA2
MTVPAGSTPTSAPPAGAGSGGALSTRLEALARFVRAAGSYLPGERLEPSRQVLERATQRLMLSHQHTVVALAGTTGSGKSSLFNAIAGRQLSPVGVRRPTTGEAYACVWGPEGDAADLLDWLKLPPSHRFSLDLAGDRTDLRGLVLLDLPDCDSIERDHAAEVRRMLEMVDAVVWVVDPQKYADQVIHEEHLPRFRRHFEITVVALNQADLLSAADLERLLDDLRRLLAAGGLGRTLAMATSALDAPTGLAQLRSWLERLVGGRRAAVQRLAGDVDLAAEELTGLVGPPVPDGVLERTALPELTEGLARVAGVTAVTEVVETSYRRRAATVTGSPPLRWIDRLRPQPLQRLPFRSAAATDQPPPVTEGMSQRAAASLLARAVATQVAGALPAPWPDAVVAAARSRLGDLTRDLDRVTATAAPHPTRTPVWWHAVAVAQWLATGAALIGLAWLAVTWLLRWLGLPAGAVDAGALPAPVLLLGAGLLAGAVVTGLAIPLVGHAARRARAETAGQLRSELSEVGRERVIEPVDVVLDAYREARVAFHTARGEA